MLDDLDHRLIALLRANSRTPVAALARNLHVNRATVTSRIDRLVDSGVIEGFTLRLGNDVDRDAIRGVTTVTTAPNEGQDVVREIRGYPEVEGLHSTTGAWDLVVQLRCRSLSEFDLVLERIRALPGVRDTQTSLLFNSLTNEARGLPR
jgi:DNA-binding Lrp family transcriptional regulator